MTTPTPFVDSARLATVTAGDATEAISAALSVARGYTGQTLTAVSGDVAECDPHDDGSVYLRELPVTAVSAVSVWAQAPDGSLGWTDVGPTNYRVIQSRGEVRVYSTPTVPVRWSREPGSVRVTYDHGFATAPDDLADIVLQIAAMLQSNPRGLAMRRVGEKVNTFAPVTNGVTLRDSWKAVLDRYTNPWIA